MSNPTGDALVAAAWPKRKYLIRTVGGTAKAHIWLGDDTACTMYSTGGLSKERFAVHDHDQGRRICQMCTNALKHPKVRE